MSAGQSIVLITGANGGIGFETVAQLMADPKKHVLLGSRSIEKGQASVKELQSRKLPGTVELLQIDVDSDKSVEAAARDVESKHGRLDTLVNNAAIAPMTGSMTERMLASYNTNAVGCWRTVEAFKSLLQKASSTARIINVSSGGGSIALRLDPNSIIYNIKDVVHYHASKAALNMVSASQQIEIADPLGFKIFLYCPGYTASNLTALNSIEHGAKPTSEGVAPLIKIINGERDAEHGGFLHATGQHPW